MSSAPDLYYRVRALPGQIQATRDKLARLESEARLLQMEDVLRRRGQHWPDRDVANLRAWWGSGMTAGQVARRFRGKYSRSAVLGKVVRLGLQRWRQG